MARVKYGREKDNFVIFLFQYKKLGVGWGERFGYFL